MAKSKISAPSVGYVHMTQLYQNLMRSMTTEFAGWFTGSPSTKKLTAMKKAFLSELMMTIVDPDPNLSLETFAEDPCPFFIPGMMEGPITPKEKWKELEKNVKYWPKPVQKASKALGVGSGKLPTWEKIEDYFDSFGFDALPVQGYVGGPIYTFLLHFKKVPVCTQWVIRFKKSPYYVVPTDTFHDLGHGLAFAMKDYRDLLVKFSTVAFKTAKYQVTPELNHYYGWFFEHAYVYDKNKNVEPIGAAPMAFETLEVSKGKLVPKLKDTKLLKNQKQGHRPFKSRDHWHSETEKFIDRLRKKIKS